MDDAHTADGNFPPTSGHDRGRVSRLSERPMALVLCRETTKIHSGAPNATCSCTLQPSRLFPALGDGLAIWPLLCLSAFQDISGQSFFSFRWTRVEPDRAVFVFDSVQVTTSPRGFPAGCTSSSSMANTPCARAGEPHPHWSQPYRIPASTLASAAIPRQLAAAAASQHATWHTNAFQIGAIHVLLQHHIPTSLAEEHLRHPNNPCFYSCF